MNNTFKKMAIVAGLSLSGLALASTAVLAQTATNPFSLAIDNSGNVHLAGTVSAISGTNISVSSWGGTWTINASAATFLPPSSSASIAEVKVGDTLKIDGTVSSGMSVNATKILDKSVHNAKKYTGAVGNLNVTAGTFTLSTQDANNVTTNVNVVTDTNTKVSVNGTASTLANLANGTQVSASGNFNATTNTLLAANIQAPPVKKHMGWGIGAHIMAWFKNR